MPGGGCGPYTSSRRSSATESTTVPYTSEVRMTTSSLSQTGLDRLHRAMVARVEKGELPGLVTVVARGDEARFDAIGTMAFDGAEPVRPDTIFRIASLTKPILAAATMMLVEDGALALNEPTFDPPFPIVQAAGELQLVLGAPDPRTPHDPDRWIERFGTLPLMYQPGERWQYNTAALVLGVLVARAAGQPLEALLGARLFEPLGMRDTGFWMPADRTSRLPTQYVQDFATGTVGPSTLTGTDVWSRPPAFPSGAGGLVSTGADYLTFARLLLSGGVHLGKRLLSERSVAAMTTNHLTPEQIAGGGILLGGSGWGYGMAVTVTPDAVSSPGRYGWSGGYGTTWFNVPSRRLIAIALTQVDAFLWNGGLTEFGELAAQA